MFNCCPWENPVLVPGPLEVEVREAMTVPYQSPQFFLKEGGHSYFRETLQSNHCTGLSGFG